MLGVLLGGVMAVAPLACWALLARARVVGWIVGAVLVVGTSAVAVVLATQAPRPEQVFWLLDAYFVGSVAVVAVGRLVERRHSPLPGGGRRRIGRILFGWYAGIAALCVAGLTLFAAGYDEPYVDESEVLPLPPGLRLIEKGQVGCGSGTCSMQFVIGGEQGTPVEQLAQQVRDHLTRSRGWHLNAQGTACREEEPNADYQSSDIAVSVRGDQVIVDLASGKGYGQRACPDS